MPTYQLTEAQWAFIVPLLPNPARTGRPRADDRKTVEGILFVLRSGCRWRDMPQQFGSPVTVCRRLKQWGALGIWDRIWRAVLAALERHQRIDWSMGFLDGSFVPAKKGVIRSG